MRAHGLTSDGLDERDLLAAVRRGADDGQRSTRQRAETSISGAPFGGADFVKHTPLGERTKVDLEGDFPALRGMSEADELATIDGFFTALVDEDTATLRTWTPQ